MPAAAVALDDVLNELDGVVGRLERLAQSAHLHAEADVDAVDRFLVRAYEEAWSGEPAPEPTGRIAPP